MSKTWSEHYWHSIPCMKARIEELARLCAGTVLEVGCNDGFLTQCIRERGLEVTGVEISLPAIAQAKAQFGEDFPIVHGDACKLPFGDGTFDTVVGGEILEHLENPGTGLAEMFRVARQQVILSLPIGHYWLGEPTHLWELHGETVEHDQGMLRPIAKELLILQWEKRRRWENGQVVDLPGWNYDPEKTL